MPELLLFKLTREYIYGSADLRGQSSEPNARSKEDGMKKQKLESLLGNGENTPDLGPIENYLHAVATEVPLPDLAIAVCALRIEEAAPALHALLVRAADGEELSDDESLLLFRGLHILGGARDSRAFRPLLRLLGRPIDEVDDLLGDAVTESMAKIVTGVFDGNVDALFDAMSDPSIDEFIREALIGAATFLAWEGRIARDRMQRFIERFYEARLAPDGDQAWIGWLNAIALLGLRDQVPLVDRAWHGGRIPVEILDRRDFDEDLAAAGRAPDDIDRFRNANLGYIEDVLETLDWTRRAAEDKDEEEDEYEEEEQYDRLWTDPEPSRPVINPWRRVGRNDPCPCGSGKKAKKCCLPG